LIDEKSPYLIQHAGNPVNWYPWGKDAFDKARKEDKPVFLSIGYSTCHWCHVMAHESFEDEEVALLLNESYVAIKVDREERPDVDKIYILRVNPFSQALISQSPAGWEWLVLWISSSRLPPCGKMTGPLSSKRVRILRPPYTMRSGGIFDQIGLGFHRYSVDEKWLVPHFEKMLYDQALLAMAYIEAYQATGKVRFAQVAREIFTYVLRDMNSPEGGFYSAEDADSEGREGLFYLWIPLEVKEHLGEELGDLFCRFYGITEGGNFEEGRSIPHVPVSTHSFAAKEGMDLPGLEKALKDGRDRLFDIRKKRVHPLKDDKILTSWNGLMIAALAKGYQVFGDQAYVDAASDAAKFILSNLRTAGGRLLRRYRQGDAACPGYLDDYAFLVWGLIELYEATFKISYLEEAIALNQAMIDIFWDKQSGGLYFIGKGNESLITRSKEIYDGALPSGNSVAALNFLRLGRLTGNTDLEKKADQLTRVFAAEVMEHPMAYTQLLVALDFMVGPSQEIVMAGDPAPETMRDMLNVVQRKFLPNKVVLVRQDGAEGKRLATLSPFVEPMHSVDHQPTVYLCEQYSCKKPITKVSELKTVLH
jgi:uncharacterized protein YyaL (SSP411 family)